MNTLTDHTSLAESAGFGVAAKNAHSVADRARRLMQAYEHFRYVCEEKISEFNLKLYKATCKREGKQHINMYEVYDKLNFVPTSDYPLLPPTDVLEKVKAAKDMGVFDEFEVCSVTSVREYKDPIIFGRIVGCTDRFYIADWGDDVRITDLLDPNEG